MSPRLSAGMGLGAFLTVEVTAGFVAAGVSCQGRQGPLPQGHPIQSADKEANGDFEMTLKEGERTFGAGVKPDGKLLNIQEAIAESKVPKAVKDGLMKKHADARIVETEKGIVIDGKKEKTTYEMKVRTKGKTLEVRLDEEGKPAGD